MANSYPIVREQDMLAKDAPNEYGYWSEDAIRNYQETHGVNYGQAVFVRGESPYREWSNDRYFGGPESKQVNGPKEIKTPLVARQDNTEEVTKLQAEIQSLRDMIAQMASVRHMPELTSKGLDRHGLAPEHNIHPSQMDKRTRQYKEWAASQKKQA